ncbi:hypothetical protein CPC08DRAFT_771336 [Agrocybe pediades]|nr:hypothetical protein CPC08DRAFT_25912 [Agrocybe pediades]KAF9537257.1 hypothetical protein CPC08DRAFT_771336 [Agrocybe pediades]
MNLKLSDKDWQMIDFSSSERLFSPRSDVDDLDHESRFSCSHSCWRLPSARSSVSEQPTPSQGSLPSTKALLDYAASRPAKPIPPLPFRHTSDPLHDIMLSMYPEADIAITEDDELLHHFRNLDSNDPTSTPAHDQLVDRLKELYEIKYDGVVVYLVKKQNPTPPGEDAAKHDSDSGDQT